MWKLLFYVKADQKGYESSWCLSQVVEPVLELRPLLGPVIGDIAVQCRRSEAAYGQIKESVELADNWVTKDRYWKGTRRFVVSQAQSLRQITDALPFDDVTDMTDPDQLARFIEWGIQQQPSIGRPALVIWSHGGAWNTSMAMKVVPVDPAERIGIPGSGSGIHTTVRDAGPVSDTPPVLLPEGRPPIADQTLRAAARTRYVHRPATEQGPQAESSQAMSVEAAGASLPTLRKGLSKGLEQARRDRLELIAFNSCFMACIEAAYEIRELADYMVASQEETAFESWKHALWMSRLHQKRTTSAASMAKLMVTEYPAVEEGTLSAVQLGDGISQLAERIRDFVEAALALSAKDWAQLRKARSKVREYGVYGGSQDFFMVDIVKFFNGVPKKNGARAAAQAVSMACKSAVLKRKRGAERCNGYGSNGLSIFFPPTRAHFEGLAMRERYSAGGPDSPAFVRDSRWRKFLDEYWARTDPPG